MTGARKSDDRRLDDFLEYVSRREYETPLGMMLSDADHVDHVDSHERVDRHEHVRKGDRSV